MRCKFCDARLEHTQYRWDEEKKEFVEKCGGRCVLKDDYTGYQPDPGELTLEVDDVVQWVPERD